MSSSLSTAFRAILVVGKTVLRHYDEANIACNSSLLPIMGTLYREKIEQSRPSTLQN